MGMHTARRRGELLVLSMLSLLVLAVTVLVAVSIVAHHRPEEPRLTQFVQISDQGQPSVDPFAGEPSSGSTPGPADR